MKCDKLEKWYAGQCSPFFVVYGANDVDATITELKSENERLKAKLEDARATVAFNYLDAVTRERRLRRALWLARALRARDIQRWWIAATCAPATERACSVWNIVERKCLKKAEKYR